MKEKIMKAAFELFSQRGIRSVTMDDIAHALGMSKRTIYENFKDKSEILDMIADYTYNIASRELSDIINNTPSCLTGILAAIYNFFTSKKFENKPNENYFIDLRKYYPKIDAKIRERRQKHMLSLSKYLQKGVEQGTVRNDLNLDLAAMLLATQIEGLDVMKSITKNFSPKEIIKTMMLSFCRGISTRKGLDEIDEFLKKHEF